MCSSDLPPGNLGSDHLRNRNRDARIIINDLSGNIKRRSMMERLHNQLEEYAKTGENPYSHLFNEEEHETPTESESSGPSEGQSMDDYLFND